MMRPLQRRTRGKGQGGEEDDGIAPAADEGKGQGGEKAVAADASVAANAKLEMDGHHLMVGHSHVLRA